MTKKAAAGETPKRSLWDQVKSKFDAGEVDGDTYTWREGFKDWLRLFDIEDFASLASASNAATPLALSLAAGVPAALS